ncbi:unnamed protein product [Agarophyton chilense]
MIAILLSCKVHGRKLSDTDVCGKFNIGINLMSPLPGRNCIATLSDPKYEKRFDVCKSSVCFILKWETPMLQFNRSLTVESADVKYRLPFRCGESSKWHPSLTGMAIEILLKTSAREEYCVWAGDPNECTWNGLVEYTDAMADRGYQFTIVGPMLETPGRMCHHFTSTAFLDDPMVVVGRNIPHKKGVGEQILQITSPFTFGSWIVLGTVVFLFVLVSVIIVYTFHGSRSHSLVTMYLVLVGDQKQALEYSKPDSVVQEEENKTPLESSSSVGTSSFFDCESLRSRRLHDTQSVSYRQSYFCTTSLCRFAFLGFLSLFFLFYEAAVVQSLFQQERVTITRSVTSLSDEELRHFAVMKDSAFEDIWTSTVDPDYTEDWTNKSKVPWQRCPNTKECIEWLTSESRDVDYVVSSKSEANFLVHQVSDCEELTITDTKESLHKFNSGWLHNKRVDKSKRRTFDRELVFLRIDGTVQSFSEELENGKCKPRTKVNIGPFILLAPIVVLVFPPLILSVIVLYR